MALSTYNDLKSAVANWLRRSDLSPYLDDLITLAETRINREVRTRELESALSVTVSSGTATVPSDFMGLKYAYISSSPSRQLRVASPRQVFDYYPNRSETGDADMVAVDGSTFIFGPLPADGSIMAGTYYAKPSALSSAVSDLFTAHPDLFLFAALAETQAFVKDEKRVALWEQKYQAIKEEVMRQDQNARFSGPLAITVS